jgi:hypothetical protein
LRSDLQAIAALTGHALEKNMEAGVVISDGHIPTGLTAHDFRIQ